MDHQPKSSFLLLLSIFTVAVCGLVYELLAGTMSSYLVGDSVYQFSITIGIFMSSMGLGSYLSRFINKELPASFVFIEILLGIIGGFSTVFLFFAFAKLDNYNSFLFIICILIGTLIGLEIPIILRILNRYESMKIMVSNILTADYIGALAGAILFPLVFVPYLGLVKTGVFFGLMNLAAASLALYIFKEILTRKKELLFLIVSSALVLVVLFFMSAQLTTFLEDSLYSDEIIFAETTPYQRIIITRRGDDVAMFINGSIQFSTQDEYRYHEALIHPAMSALNRKEDILILGGGDGLAAKELLKYPEVKSITIVDIDPAVTRLFKNNKLLVKANQNSLNNPKVKIVNEDAWKFLEKSSSRYDFIVVDLPDPHDLNISKLYTKTFYKMLANHLNANGVMVTQSTSPLYAQKAFWCIHNTLADVASPYQKEQKLFTTPYHVFVPSFGEWGFVMASLKPINWQKMKLQPQTRYLSNELLKSLIIFPKDMEKQDSDVNTIDSHILVKYYNDGWDKWYK